MQKFTKEFTTYDLGEAFDGFSVEVYKEDEAVLFYLYHKCYGVKSLMFGVLANTIKNEEELLNLIASSIDGYISIYKKDYIDCY